MSTNKMMTVALVAALFGHLPSAASQEIDAGGRPAAVQFNRDIRPILADKCFQCHGPDANHREADLRLDTEEGSRADLGAYRAIVPGKPTESELMARITHESKNKRMPYWKSGKTLTGQEIELLRRWIEQGAAYQPHWSFIAPKKPAVPRAGSRQQTANREQRTANQVEAIWPRGAIDSFLLDKMQAQGLKPSPEADRITLIRRLCFDLTGLPPSSSQAAAFLADSRPDAYERLVEQLLASPHFGERMAMYWLDLVRYADTVGYHGDQEHRISPYRDYVIKAGRRPAAGLDHGAEDRFGLQPAAPDHARGRRPGQGIPGQVHGRPRPQLLSRVDGRHPGLLRVP
jgi:mono/diheme cytochrome c family protein